VITLCFSIVLYMHPVECIERLLNSICSFAACAPGFRVLVCIYDGSPVVYPGPSEEQLQSRLPGIEVLFEKGKNVGFGRANNNNFLRSSLRPNDLFAVVNPDIRFSAEQLLPLVEWLCSDSECACAAPLVLLEDGGIQYSAKHDPTILSLLLGRFGFLKRVPIFHEYDSWHRNLQRDYSSELIPSSYLSGCFLLLPVWAFHRVGGFCEQYFLHVEDADIVRRLSGVGKTLHNPIGVVVHGWARGSHSSIFQMLSLLKSFMIYSRIWGLRIC
jgi:GT2 family glycosyltransferase